MACSSLLKSLMQGCYAAFIPSWDCHCCRCVCVCVCVSKELEGVATQHICITFVGRVAIGQPGAGKDKWGAEGAWLSHGCEFVMSYQCQAVAPCGNKRKKIFIPRHEWCCHWRQRVVTVQFADYSIEGNVLRCFFFPPHQPSHLI